MTADAAPPTVRLPLIALVAAARIASAREDHGLSADIAQALSSAAEAKAAQHAGVAAFFRAVRTPDPKMILPFDADPLTIDVTALSMPLSKREGGVRLYSRLSHIELGYFACDHADCRYVDRGPQPAHFARAPEISPLGLPEDWLAAYARLANQLPELMFPPDAADRLQVRLPVAEVKRWRSGAQGGIRLLQHSSRGGQPARDLGRIRIDRSAQDDGILSIRLGGEQQLELHAAAFEGRWIGIAAGDCALIAQIPGLDPDAPGSPCRVRLPHITDTGPPGLDVYVSTPAALAALLVQRFCWLGPSVVSDWHAMLTQPSWCGDGPS